MGQPRRQSELFVIITLVGVVIALPLILYGPPVVSADAAAHSVYYEAFREQLFAGEFYPRWLADMNGGLGGPTFFFYPPLLYYFTSIFGLLPIDTWHQLGLSAAAGLALSGITALLWLREFAPPRIATIVAIIYLLFPYRTFDLYGRGALAEAFAFVWMPLSLFFVVRLAHGQRFALAGIAVTMTMLLLTHTLTAMMFVPVLIAYGGYHTLYQGDRKRFLLLLIAIVLGTGLAGAYLVPAMTTRGMVYWHEMLGDHTQWFLSPGQNLGSHFFWMTVQAACLGALAFLIGRRNLVAPARDQLFLWTILLLGAIFMTTVLSEPVWRAIKPLRTLQFPWRYQVVICLILLPLLALAAASVKRPLGYLSLVALLCTASFGVLWVWGLTEAAWSPRAPITTSPVHEGIVKYRYDGHGFWPRWAPTNDHHIEEILGKIPVSQGARERAFIAQGNGSAEVREWKPRSVDIDVDTPVETEVVVTQFYYPAWRARIPDPGIDLTVRPADLTGLTTITVPPGRHRVELRLEMLDAERNGWAISAVSAAMFLAMLLGQWFRRSVESPAPQGPLKKC